MNLLSKWRGTVMLLLLIPIFISQKSMAQSKAEEFMKAGPDDAEKLIKAYVTPFFKGFGSALNSSWYNTAKPHPLGGFDVTLTFNGAFVPDGDKTYNVNDLGLQTLRLQPGEDPTAQTVSGSKDDGPTMDIVTQTQNGNDTVIGALTIPGGTGYGYSGAPILQVSVGLIKNTEVMVRFVPNFALPNDLGTVGMIGVGLKHDIKQWIPVVKDLPFDLSAYFGYTAFRYSMGFSILPEPGTVQKPGTTVVDYSTQEMNVRSSATNFGLIVSKKIAILTLYGGLGYNSSNSKASMDGTYPVAIEVNSDGEREITNYTDPISFDMKGANSIKADLGARVKLGLFAINASYMFAKYPVASLGLGINFR